MKALCIGRHTFLSEHLCRFFDELGIDTVPCVGMTEAVAAVPLHEPDVIICDYDLLATIPLTSWENDPVLARLPFIAVSMTRHPGEAHLLDVNGIAGFLYLPTLDPADAHRVLSAVRQTRGGINPPSVLPWQGTTPLAQLR
jgi:hypothetical protein